VLLPAIARHLVFILLTVT